VLSAQLLREIAVYPGGKLQFTLWEVDAVRRTVFVAAVCVLMSVPALADFSTIKSATSGSEPDLWQVLDVVAPLGGGSWGSTVNLNNNTSGRRVLDRPDAAGDVFDQIWAGQADVTVSTLFWGGKSRPCDSGRQYFRYDDNVDGSSPINLTGVDDPGDTVSLSYMASFIIGDGGGSVGAWSRESLNASTRWDRNNNDRMVTFDVSGLDIYSWNYDNSTSLVSSAIAGSAWIVAFDPGSDGDYQDMLVLIEGASPVPVPGAALLGILGLGAAGTKLRRRLA
jgi:hypothetical protein